MIDPMDDEFSEIVNAEIDRVDLVDKAANGTPFLLMKRAGDNPSLLPPDTVEQLIKQAEEPTMTDNAPVEIVAKADDLDVTEPLAEPETGTPQMNADQPGSPAWESVDAATAAKWVSVLARAKSALSVLAEREYTEAIAGDADGEGNAWDMEDAACVIDYAIDLLASYGAGETAQAEISDELAKAAAALSADDLDVVESLGAVRKAGRTLSAANEDKLRSASESIQSVLASLPAAPEEITKKDVVAKADGDNLVAVFNAKGNLIGVVKPAAIQAVDGGSAEPEDGAAEKDDLTPEDSADAGIATSDAAETLAPEAAAPDDTPDDGTVTKSVGAVTMDEIAELVKARVQDELSERDQLIDTLTKKIAFLEAPATPKVLANGARPTPQMLRGQDKGDMSDSLMKAEDVAELRKSLDKATTAEERELIANQMQVAAMGALTAARVNGKPLLSN